MFPAVTQGMEMCEQLGNLIECFEVAYPPFSPSLSGCTRVLPAVNNDSLFGAYMPTWQFLASVQN